MEKPEDLNETDVEILKRLANGRETRGSLADDLELHRNYVGERLKLMRMQGLVKYYHKPTSLWQITEKGEGWLEEAQD